MLKFFTLYGLLKYMFENGKTGNSTRKLLSTILGIFYLEAQLFYKSMQIK